MRDCVRVGVCMVVCFVWFYVRMIEYDAYMLCVCVVCACMSVV